MGQAQEIQKLVRNFERIERWLGNMPARFARPLPQMTIRFGKVFGDPIEPGGSGKVKLWKFTGSGSATAATKQIVDVTDAASILQNTHAVGQRLVVGRVLGQWIVLSVKVTLEGARFEGKLDTDLIRGGEADFHRVIWNGSAWVEDPDALSGSSSSESLKVRDISRIPIGQKLQTDDQIGVIELHGRFWLEAYDCEDLVAASGG